MTIDLDRCLYPSITRERFEALRTDRRARRICFKTTHAGEPKSGTAPGFAGTLNVPFFETIGHLLEVDANLKLFQNRNVPGSYWCHFRQESEFLQCKEWVKRQGTRVFLRDCLNLSIALGMNIVQSEDGLQGHTPLGDLEARAKAAPDVGAIEKLVAAFADAISSLPGYRDAKLIAAVPPRPGKTYDLPSVLARHLATARSLTDLTGRFGFARPKGSVKAAKVADKWADWEQSGLALSPNLSGRPDVIVIDDKYQSGTSIQFVSSVLRASGAGKIYGVCAVKTLRDTDNA